MKKRVIIFLAVILLLVAAGIYFTRNVTEQIEGTNSKVEKNTYVLDSQNLPSKKDQISVVNVEGTAEKKSRGGDWSPMNKGDLLAVEDSVRTQKESQVVLGLGEKSIIELNDASEIEVRELSGVMQRLGLVKGRASVDYGEDGNRILNIENNDGTVVAKVDKGKFSILNNGQIVAVATETGSVDLSSQGESVIVTKGMESVVTKGKAPSKPYAISADAYLKLSAGACKKQDGNRAIVHGTVARGTTVSVNKQSVEINPDGSFIAYLKIPKNRRRIQLKTVDVWGKAREKTIMCLEPKKHAPIKKIDIDWGKKEGN